MMLLPFAWMIVTSLKAPSEINEWPPKWSTKNFKKEWTLNLQVAPSSYDILSLIHIYVTICISQVPF